MNKNLQFLILVNLFLTITQQHLLGQSKYKILTSPTYQILMLGNQYLPSKLQKEGPHDLELSQAKSIEEFNEILVDKYEFNSSTRCKITLTINGVKHKYYFPCCNLFPEKTFKLKNTNPPSKLNKGEIDAELHAIPNFFK